MTQDPVERSRQLQAYLQERRNEMHRLVEEWHQTQHPDVEVRMVALQLEMDRAERGL